MNIDLPNDHLLCYKEGWADALAEVMHLLNRKQDKYRMPESYQDQKYFQHLEEMKNIITRCSDIQATLATVQDRESQ